jgi:hypothetical protein
MKLTPTSNVRYVKQVEDDGTIDYFKFVGENYQCWRPEQGGWIEGYPLDEFIWNGSDPLGGWVNEFITEKEMFVACL